MQQIMKLEAECIARPQKECSPLPSCFPVTLTLVV